MSHKQDELAVKECLVLWKYLAQSGSNDKRSAIKKLHKQGKLSKEHYTTNCPFCEQFFVCSNCPWRTVSNLDDKCTGCMQYGSHYLAWGSVYEGSRKERQKAASAVYKFLKQIKI